MQTPDTEASTLAPAQAQGLAQAQGPAQAQSPAQVGNPATDLGQAAGQHRGEAASWSAAARTSRVGLPSGAVVLRVLCQYSRSGLTPALWAIAARSASARGLRSCCVPFIVNMNCGAKAWGVGIHYAHEVQGHSMGCWDGSLKMTIWVGWACSWCICRLANGRAQNMECKKKSKEGTVRHGCAGALQPPTVL